MRHFFSAFSLSLLIFVLFLFLTPDLALATHNGDNLKDQCKDYNVVTDCDLSKRRARDLQGGTVGTCTYTAKEYYCIDQSSADPTYPTLVCDVRSPLNCGPGVTVCGADGGITTGAGYNCDNWCSDTYGGYTGICTDLRNAEGYEPTVESDPNATARWWKTAHCKGCGHPGYPDCAGHTNPAYAGCGTNTNNLNNTPACKDLYAGGDRVDCTDFYNGCPANIRDECLRDFCVNAGSLPVNACPDASLQCDGSRSCVFPVISGGSTNPSPSPSPSPSPASANCSVTLTAVPTNIKLTESSTLTYRTTNVDSCVGSASLSGNNPGPSSTTSTLTTVTPTRTGTYTYTLNCYNSATHNSSTHCPVATAQVTVGYVTPIFACSLDKTPQNDMSSCTGQTGNYCVRLDPSYTGLDTGHAAYQEWNFGNGSGINEYPTSVTYRAYTKGTTAQTKTVTLKATERLARSGSFVSNQSSKSCSTTITIPGPYTSPNPSSSPIPTASPLPSLPPTTPFNMTITMRFKNPDNTPYTGEGMNGAGVPIYLGIVGGDQGVNNGDCHWHSPWGTSDIPTSSRNINAYLLPNSWSQDYGFWAFGTQGYSTFQWEIKNTYWSSWVSKEQMQENFDYFTYPVFPSNFTVTRTGLDRADSCERTDANYSGGGSFCISLNSLQGDISAQGNQCSHGTRYSNYNLVAEYIVTGPPAAPSPSPSPAPSPSPVPPLASPSTSFTGNTCYDLTTWPTTFTIQASGGLAPLSVSLVITQFGSASSTSFTATPLSGDQYSVTIPASSFTTTGSFTAKARVVDAASNSADSTPISFSFGYCGDPWLKTTGGDIHSNSRINLPPGP